MFKLPAIPSPQAPTNELADFAEWLAFVRGATSSREIQAALGREAENESNEGCDDEADDLANELDVVMNEVERRSNACGGAYPFRLTRQGTAIEYTQPQDTRSNIYTYLLLATRLNMTENRDHDNINGTELLEHLGAEVLANYVGGTHNDGGTQICRSRGIVFGTGVPGNFEDKVNDLISKLGEGGLYRALDDGDIDEKDDKLDVVVWVPFSDGKAGKLIIFGQCKTGTSWDPVKTQLQPLNFNNLWMSSPFLLTPVRALIVAEASNLGRWCRSSVGAGLFLDRCRIVDFSYEVSPELAARIIRWTEAAKLWATGQFLRAPAVKRPVAKKAARKRARRRT